MNRPEPTPLAGLAAGLTELANLLLATPSLRQLLDHLADLAAQVIAPPGVCGITLQQDHLPLTIASSGALASHLDEVQYDGDDGPCLQAMRTGETVHVTDFSSEHRWGAYPAHALTYGARSSVSVPLIVNGDARGALNVYASTPHAFDEAAHQRAAVFAAQASAALAVAIRQSQQTKLTEQLREALATRAVIDQAVGILMAQERCGHDAAFGLLRNASQHQNRKLHDIATEMVTAVSGQAPGPPRFEDPRR